MKVLSIRQPWADAIIYLGKDIENRTWKTKYRGRILIHAGKKVDYTAPENLFARLTRPDQMQTGGIVGQAYITDCVEESKSEWFEGPYGFVLALQQFCNLIPCKGQLGIYDLKDPLIIKRIYDEVGE